MVKVSGPALSLQASGKLGGALVFATWKGRPYVRGLVRPANPKSGGQVGMRSMMKFCSQQWAGLGASPKASWDIRADDRTISPFNAFCGLNQDRWRNFLSPTQADPPTETGTVGTIINEAATGAIRQIDVEAEVSVLNDNWGLMIFRWPTTGFSTTWSNCVQIIPAASAATFHWIDTPLVAGAYFYNFRPFTDDGVIGAEVGEVTATAT